mgnify:CR=1 FL=1
MQKVKFVTEEQDKIVVWCETNSNEELRVW